MIILALTVGITVFFDPILNIYLVEGITHARFFWNQLSLRLRLFLSFGVLFAR